MSRPYTVGAVETFDGRWHIRLRAGNGKVVAVGAQAFVTKFSADRAALNLSVATNTKYVEPRCLKKS